MAWFSTDMGGGGITTLGTVETIKKATEGKSIICRPSLLLLVQDFQQSNVI